MSDQPRSSIQLQATPAYSPSGAVIVVTYNSSSHIDRCLDSLKSHGLGWPVIVVDNGSTDGTQQLLRLSHPSVALLTPSANLGFAGGCNAGVAKAGSVDFYLFLNPDVILQGGALEKLIATARERGAGAVGAQLTDSRGRYQHGFAVRGLPTPWFLALDLLLVNHLWPRNPAASRVRIPSFDPSRDQLVEQPAGACLLVASRAFTEIGGFDDQFHPLWFEDVDLCRRLKDRGFKIWYCSAARVLHAGGHSLGTVSPFEAKAFWYANLVRYAEKHFGRSWARALRGLVVIGTLLRGLITLVHWRARDAQAVDQFRLMWRALRKGNVQSWYNVDSSAR